MAPSKPTKNKSNSFDDLISLQAQYKANRDKRINIEEVKELKKRMKKVCTEVKQHIHEADQKPITRTSRLRLRTTQTKTPKKEQQCLYTQGKYVNKGIDESRQVFSHDEIEYLENNLKKVKDVNKLNFDQLQYLITHKYFQKLKDIKEGTVKSEMHDRYIKQKGKSSHNLITEIKTTLFSNEQRDYINGCLQGAFDATSLDDNGDIKHSDIDYLSTVLFYEITILIVQHVHKLDSYDSAREFMIQHTREAFLLNED